MKKKQKSYKKLSNLKNNLSLSIYCSGAVAIRTGKVKSNYIKGVLTRFNLMSHIRSDARFFKK